MLQARDMPGKIRFCTQRHTCERPIAQSEGRKTKHRGVAEAWPKVFFGRRFGMFVLLVGSFVLLVVSCWL